MFYVISSACSHAPSQSCLSLPQKAFISDLAFAVTVLVIGILGTASVIGMPPSVAYALLGFSGYIVIVDIAKCFISNYLRKKQNRAEKIPHLHQKNKVESLSELPEKSSLSHEKPSLSHTLPMTYYTLDSEKLSFKHWPKNSLNLENRPDQTQGYTTHSFPVASSPEHGVDSFILVGQTRQHVIFDDGTVVTHLDFQLPPNASFMKPNVDTMLICSGLHTLFQEGIQFKRAIDVGAGSGFIAKYLALNQPKGRITAIDIDPMAEKYMLSQEAAMPQNVIICRGDALTHLSRYANQYNLIVSNPPYVPTPEQTETSKKVEIKDPSFWKGTGLICHMLEDSLEKMPKQGHLVIVIPSTALKSKRLNEIFHNYSSNYQARILYQQEVAYKAAFAGDGKVTHLLATEEQRLNPTHFKGMNLSLFVGITSPGQPRACKIEDGRRDYRGYYWQMIYIIDFSKQQKRSNSA